MPAVLFIAMLAAAPANLTPGLRPTLAVALIQDTRQPFDAAGVTAVGRAVAAIWSRYADVSVYAVDDPLAIAADDVLTVRITDRRSQSGDGLGWIDFVDGQPSRTIYVSRTEVSELAARGKWGGRAVTYWPPKMRDAFAQRAVATAVAHEIGHYLLRSRVHTRTGLMRASLTVEDVMRGFSVRNGLDRAQQAVLQQRMRGYLIARSAISDVTAQ
jgi:hypothetical protein